MRIQNLMTACGAALAITAAGAAHAQTDRNTDRQTDQRHQDTLQDKQQRSVGNPEAIKPLLQKRTGVWEVEVRMAPEYLARMKQKKQGDAGVVHRDSMKTDAEGMVTFTGYAESDAIMGNDVLREKMVFGPQLKPDGDTVASSLPADAMQGVSYLSFNPDTKRYQAVFIANHVDGIQTEEGYFDAQRNRIIFRSGTDASDGQRNWNQDQNWNQDREDAQDRWQDQKEDWEDQREQREDRREEWREDAEEAREDARERLGNQPDRARRPQIAGRSDDLRVGATVVVLEFVSDDKQKVTMYDLSGPRMTPSSPIERLNQDRENQDDLIQREGLDQDRQTQDRQTRDRLNQDRNQPGDQTQQRSQLGKIVYEATYTRAPRTAEADIRSLLEFEGTRVSRR